MKKMAKKYEEKTREKANDDKFLSKQSFTIKFYSKDLKSQECSKIFLKKS